MRLTRRSLLALIPAAAVPLPERTVGQSSSWVLLDDGSGPLARWDHALIADASRGRLYMFGGRDADGAALSDLWSFDLAAGSWTSIDAPGPVARFGMAVSATPDGSGFLLFGGQAGPDFFADVWSFDFEAQSWTQIDDGTGGAPTPRYGLGSAFDGQGRFVISHGFTFEGRFDDTWAFEPNGGWLEISPAPETRPLRRCLHEVVPIDEGARLLLYAGCSSGYGPCPQGDLWEYETATGSWTQLLPSNVPAARSNPALVTFGDGVLLVGGLTEFGPVADVWIGTRSGEGFDWKEITAAEGSFAPRSSHDLASNGKEGYLFGGLGPNGALADLWRFTIGG
ncbi:MAG: hypothetical protein E6R14_04200 [Thermomicrobiales bacterium]|nr:MAG: hypothetical protein E6R14_04200 [Thermomicrobiales bacterium]